MFKLKCVSQMYEWGKIGANSEVYKLLCSDFGQDHLDPSEPYAELWMGTHHSGPSYLRDKFGVSLESIICEHPNLLGSSVKKFGSTLPFLFKVLSIGKALSIQVHPSKEHGISLHAQSPDIYKDSNHKPEIAIALTPFEALVAFRPIGEIAAFVKHIPELNAVVGPECAADLVAATSATDNEDLVSVSIKAAYSHLMLTEPKIINQLVETLRTRLLNGESIVIPLSDQYKINTDILTEVYTRLATDFPGDVGCFSLFFLNYIQLNCGEAIFLEANLPHAYLSGDCVECMACSDNVVRAGLTPKFKDVQCLLSMLQYEPRSCESVKFSGKKKYIHESKFREKYQLHSESSKNLPELVTFAPPVEEFAVDRITIPKENSFVELLSLDSASILIIINGSGKLIRLWNESINNEQIEDNNVQSIIIINDDDDDDVNSHNNDNQHNTEENLINLKRNPIQLCENYPVGFVCETLDFNRGSIFFIGAGSSICINQNRDDDSPSFFAFRAYANTNIQ